MRELNDEDAVELQARFIQEHENWTVSTVYPGTVKAIRYPPPAKTPEEMLAMLTGPGEEIRFETFQDHSDAYNYTVRQALLKAAQDMGLRRER